jgi:hypothetical protein
MGAAELAAEHPHELLELGVACLLAHEHAHPPVALGHDLRGVGDDRHLAACDVRVRHRALANVEHQGDPAEVVGRSVIE